MIDIKFIRENPDLVAKKAKEKGVDIDIQHILDIDKKRQELDLSVQKLREDKNKYAKDKNIEKGKEIKEKLDKEEKALNAVNEEYKEWLYKIPNPAKDDVKVGKDESENEVVRKYKEPKKFSFKPKDHLDLGESLDIIDVKRAAKVSGARFGYLKNDGALLEFALIQLGMEILIKEGFIPIVPPILVTKETMKGLGYIENGGDEDMFFVEKDSLFLGATAEHAIAPIYKDELISEKDLPIRYVGFSSAFRREAGSYGKDTKGILRVHQFDKLEMVSFVKKGEDDKEQEFLLSLEEKLFQELDIPYQVVKMVTGDLGFPAARKYDIEAWMPGQDKYREVTSVSTVTDFQSRRLNMKYQDNQNREYLSVLNGTAFAIGRTIIAILENYQREDGSIEVPSVLQKYLGKKEIKSKNSS